MSSARRGGALLTLGGVLALWLLVRVAVWQPPFAPASLTVLPLGAPQLAETANPVKPAQATSENAGTQRLAPYARPAEPVWHMPSLSPRIDPPRIDAPRIDALRIDAPRIEAPIPVTPVAYSQFRAGGSAVSRRGFAGANVLAAHAYLLSAGYRSSGRMPQQSDRGATFAGNTRASGLPVPVYAPRAAEAMREAQGPSRWAMDAWALWRQSNDTPLLSGRPSYGRSQIGAVMRYNLAPSSGHAPQVHLRASAAIEGRNEREVALGASARPIPGIPVRLAAEARVSETDRRTEPRAAAYVVSEFPPVDLPAGMTGEAYVQGGYVTGDFATPFVDGQARITRELAGTDNFQLSAGAGAWGGAQDDAQRLDVGPSAGVNFRIGPARGRVSADYRFRVAGAAEPSSGPALTLSAGF